MKKKICGFILALTLILSQAATFNAYATTDPGTLPPLRIEVRPSVSDPGTLPPL